MTSPSCVINVGASIFRIPFWMAFKAP